MQQPIRTYCSEFSKQLMILDMHPPNPLSKPCTTQLVTVECKIVS